MASSSEVHSPSEDAKQTAETVRARKVAVAAAQSAPADASGSDAAVSRDGARNDPSTWPEGVSDKNEKFRVPPTVNTVASLLNPKNFCLASYITHATILTSLYLAFFSNLPRWFFVSLFLFWRSCYDVGLGILLRYQSEHKSLTRLYERWTRDRTAWYAKLLRHLARAGLPKGHEPDNYPSAFSAWLVYRHLVDLVLVNDIATYILLGYRCLTAPDEYSLLVLLQYSIGLFLMVFNYWAKVDAHRCIGDYCWYWGDFFFRKNQNLTFDGIFELFPHPMYTVGYSHYYGYSLICRSYTMLFVSLVAHLMQLVFLLVVEEPHIERTYGSSRKSLDENQYRVLYDKKSGLFPGRKVDRSLWFLHLDQFRVGDLSLIGFALYGTIVSLCLDRTYVVAQVVIWRLVHWVGLGYVLWSQSKRQMWTRLFVDRGRTLYEAFDNWKRLYYTSLAMNAVVFLGCVLRFMDEFTSISSLFEAQNAACIALGLVLISLNVWSSQSTFEAIGDFGWFYGDFFIPPEQFRHNLVYTGIYRFLNNPDCVTGYAGFYGLALMVQSWTVFFLAVFSQVLNILFLNLVEIPHMQALYARNVRQDGSLSRVIKERLNRTLSADAKKAQSRMRVEARRIRLTAMKEVYQIYKRMAVLTDQLKERAKRGEPGDRSPSPDNADPDPSVHAQSASLECPEMVQLGEEIVVRYTTSETHSDTDWVGLYEVDNPSMPGHSLGRWLYVPPGSSGELRFSFNQLPKSSGVYEARYHRDNTFEVLASQPFQVVDTDSDVEYDAQANVTPLLSPTAVRSATPPSPLPKKRS